MQLAVVAAGFTPGEADKLRRAMASWRRRGGIEPFREKLVNGMLERGYEREFAEQIYQQIQGFGEYGIPESHAASFALLAYASAYLKVHYPAAFYTSLLNNQPMGFTRCRPSPRCPPARSRAAARRCPGEQCRTARIEGSWQRR
jgi:error-prone DNA polymerase